MLCGLGGFKMIGAIVMGSIGILFLIVGFLLWKKEMISLLHSYHFDKVSESDRKAFCKLSGWGIIVIGIGILLTALLLAITDSAWSFLAFLLIFFGGLSLLIFAGKKYNH